MTSYQRLFRLKGKTAVVTGGSGLIGREIVMALSESGARVIIADTELDRAEGLMKRTDAGFALLDITSEKSINETLAGVAQREGRLDILVNCAYPQTVDWGAKLKDVPFDS